jgi:16S rRNA (cytosine967-C5)-methyltransferase
MSRWHSYFNSSRTLLESYKGEEPFASFSQKYFAANKKFGSTDRKWITHLCYCYFRLGKALRSLPVEDGIMLSIFICSAAPNEFLKTLQPDWNERTSLPIDKKIAVSGFDITVDAIFPWSGELSPGIDKKEFILSHLQQPDLFLRLRPGKKAVVLQKLQQAGIGYRIVSDTCLALPNSSKVDVVLELDKEAVVQDLSSQRVAEFLLPVRSGGSTRVWDCCSGSGGKSLLLYDINPHIDLTVSDRRASILANLKKRFKIAGIKKYKCFVADHTAKPALRPGHFELIICDAPCTGSGTWSRTPEQLYYFDAARISEYATLQKRIISDILPLLQPGGYLLYITCSVFQKENEEVAEFLNEKFHLQHVKIELLKGYNEKADTMFAALLQKGL